MKFKLVEEFEEDKKLLEENENLYKFLEPALKDIEEGNYTVFTNIEDLFKEWESL